MSGDTIPLRSVLVANRGEIARRIFRTAKAMGLATVAVYTPQDAGASFVAEADQAVRLESGGYLDAREIIAAARRTGVHCIHPGYGFLSENADFAQAVVDARLIWVGPAPKIIETMGDKIAAKQAAEAAGVPILPSSTDPELAEAVGFPLLVKASAGGGGKGMRLVDGPAELAESVAAAEREAAGSFGDDRVFLERYVAKARHVEIQVLGDNHGNVVHLGERECSIQRRHQKIIEEAPSPRLTAGMRETIAGAALRLTQAISYQSAGTVEFLLDDETGDYFFLEINTRLQVEHPVTEEITGLDLVRQQFLVAAGAPLAFGQDDISFDGHALEARLYAEDPANGFLPAAGTLEVWEPAIERPTRWDAGVASGQTIGVDYDPMLAKVVARGQTRTEAAGRLARALEDLHLGGIITNRDYLVAVLESPSFLAGDTTTDFIERVQPAANVHENLVGEAAVVAAIWQQSQNRRSDSVWGFAPSNWRNGGLADTEIAFSHPSWDEAIKLSYHTDQSGTFLFSSGPSVEVINHDGDGITLSINGVRRRYRVKTGDVAVHVQMPSTTISLGMVPRFVLPGSESPAGGLTAPMPGVVINIRCAVGDVVEAGQVLVVLEAMKMEHHLRSPINGTVTEIPISVGQQLETGAPLAIIDENDGSNKNDRATAEDGSQNGGSSD